MRMVEIFYVVLGKIGLVRPSNEDGDGRMTWPGFLGARRRGIGRS